MRAGALEALGGLPEPPLELLFDALGDIDVPRQSSPRVVADLYTPAVRDAVEPLLMAFIGLIIGFIVVIMYFPIFELAGSIR